MKKLINIDIFELMLLIESSWCDSTILRSSFLIKTIDSIYNCLEKDEIKRIYDIIKRDFKEGNTDNQKMFFARYNPDNQYLVTATDGKNKDTQLCFKFNNEYHIGTRTTFQEKFITKIVKV